VWFHQINQTRHFLMPYQLFESEANVCVSLYAQDRGRNLGPLVSSCVVPTYAFLFTLKIEGLKRDCPVRFGNPETVSY
jgi:hypothetical protein